MDSQAHAGPSNQLALPTQSQRLPAQQQTLTSTKPLPPNSASDIDLEAYQRFLSEVLPHASKATAALKSREAFSPCTGCIMSNQPCYIDENNGGSQIGQQSLRCAPCARQNATCSWTDVFCILATMNMYRMNKEDATMLYQLASYSKGKEKEQGQRQEQARAQQGLGTYTSPTSTSSASALHYVSATPPTPRTSASQPQSATPGVTMLPAPLELTYMGYSARALIQTEAERKSNYKGSKVPSQTPSEPQIQPSNHNPAHLATYAQLSYPNVQLQHNIQPGQVWSLPLSTQYQGYPHQAYPSYSNPYTITPYYDSRYPSYYPSPEYLPTQAQTQAHRSKQPLVTPEPNAQAQPNKQPRPQLPIIVPSENAANTSNSSASTTRPVTFDVTLNHTSPIPRSNPSMNPSAGTHVPPSAGAHVPPSGAGSMDSNGPSHFSQLTPIRGFVGASLVPSALAPTQVSPPSLVSPLASTAVQKQQTETPSTKTPATVVAHVPFSEMAVAIADAGTSREGTTGVQSEASSAKDSRLVAAPTASSSSLSASPTPTLQPSPPLPLSSNPTYGNLAQSQSQAFTTPANSSVQPTPSPTFAPTPASTLPLPPLSTPALRQSSPTPLTPPSQPAPPSPTKKPSRSVKKLLEKAKARRRNTNRMGSSDASKAKAAMFVKNVRVRMSVGVKPPNGSQVGGMAVDQEEGQDEEDEEADMEADAEDENDKDGVREEEMVVAGGLASATTPMEIPSPDMSENPSTSLVPSLPFLPASSNVADSQRRSAPPIQTPESTNQPSIAEPELKGTSTGTATPSVNSVHDRTSSGLQLEAVAHVGQAVNVQMCSPKPTQQEGKPEPICLGPMGQLSGASSQAQQPDHQLDAPALASPLPVGVNDVPEARSTPHFSSDGTIIDPIASTPSLSAINPPPPSSSTRISSSATASSSTDPSSFDTVPSSVNHSSSNDPSACASSSALTMIKHTQHCKPFRCPNPHCTKRYKQLVGLQYHMNHASPGCRGTGVSAAEESGDAVPAVTSSTVVPAASQSPMQQPSSVHPEPPTRPSTALASSHVQIPSHILIPSEVLLSQFLHAGPSSSAQPPKESKRVPKLTDRAVEAMQKAKSGAGKRKRGESVADAGAKRGGGGGDCNAGHGTGEGRRVRTRAESVLAVEESNTKGKGQSKDQARIKTRIDLMTLVLSPGGGGKLGKRKEQIDADRDGVDERMEMTSRKGMGQPKLGAEGEVEVETGAVAGVDAGVDTGANASGSRSISSLPKKGGRRKKGKGKRAPLGKSARKKLLLARMKMKSTREEGPEEVGKVGEKDMDKDEEEEEEEAEKDGVDEEEAAPPRKVIKLIIPPLTPSPIKSKTSNVKASSTKVIGPAPLQSTWTGSTIVDDFSISSTSGPVPGVSKSCSATSISAPGLASQTRNRSIVSPATPTPESLSMELDSESHSRMLTNGDLPDTPDPSNLGLGASLTSSSALSKEASTFFNAFLSHYMGAQQGGPSPMFNLVSAPNLGFGSGFNFGFGGGIGPGMTANTAPPSAPGFVLGKEANLPSNDIAQRYTKLEMRYNRLSDMFVQQELAVREKCATILEKDAELKRKHEEIQRLKRRVAALEKLEKSTGESGV